MKKCPICKKELGILKIGSIYKYDGKRFCSIKCKREYIDKNPQPKPSKEQQEKAEKLEKLGKNLVLIGGSWMAIGFTILVLIFLVIIIILLL